jgi:hypothetical protein
MKGIVALCLEFSDFYICLAGGFGNSVFGGAGES